MTSSVHASAARQDGKCSSSSRVKTIAETGTLLGKDGSVTGPRKRKRCPLLVYSDAMRVLHVSPSFAPAWRYGGPVQIVIRLSHALQEACVEFEGDTTT